MSTATPQAPFAPFPSRADMEPDTRWKENLYDTIEELLQPAVNGARRHYEECLAAADTEEARTLAEEEYDRATNDIQNLAKKSFQTQIVCERHERMWVMEHFGQEDQKQFDIEPDKEWKDNLTKSIKKALLPLVNDAKMDYEARFAAAGIKEGEKLAKEYRRNRKRIRRLAEEWFEAQLDRERQERMKIMEFFKQADQEQVHIGPDKAWKDDLYKTITEDLRPMMDRAKRDYKQRLASANTRKTQELAKADYHHIMENIHKLIKGGFQAQLDCEWQERMWAFKEAEREEATILARKTTSDAVADRTSNDSSISNFLTFASPRVGELSVISSSPSRDGSSTITTAPPNPRFKDEDSDGRAPDLEPRRLRPLPICLKRNGAFIQANDILAYSPKAPTSRLSFFTLPAQLLDTPTSDLPLNLAALPNHNFPIIWQGSNTISRASGDPLPLMSSFSSPEIHRPSSPPADDQVPTEAEGELQLPLFNGYSSPSDGNLDMELRRRIEWKKVLGEVEKSFQEGEILRGDEDSHSEEAVPRKEEEQKYRELEARMPESKSRYWEELGRREQELKEREEAVKRKELDFMRKEEAVNRKEREIGKRGEELLKREQDLKKGEEEAKQRELELKRKEKALRREEKSIRLRQEAVRLREEELLGEICCFEEKDVGQKREESHAEDARLQLEVSMRTEEEPRQEVPRWGERNKPGRKEQSGQLEWRRGEERRREELRERDGELQCNDTGMNFYRNQLQAELCEREACDVDADERKEDEIWQREQTEQGQEFPKTCPELEADECNSQLGNTQILVNRSSTCSYFPSSTIHSTWTISQTFAWFPSRSSIISVQTSISSHETVSEHHDGGIMDWQCRQQETYQRQEEQFRREQGQLKSLG